MTPPFTSRPNNSYSDAGHSHCVEGSHCEGLMPQYNFSDVASVQAADQAIAVGDQYLFDLALDVPYTGEYSQTLDIENEQDTDETFVILGRDKGLESIEAAMMGTNNHAGPDPSLVSSEWSQDRLSACSEFWQHDAICRWIAAAPGLLGEQLEAAAELQSSTLPLSSCTASDDHSDWVDISCGSARIEQDPQGLGSMFSIITGCASYNDELD